MDLSHDPAFEVMGSTWLCLEAEMLNDALREGGVTDKKRRQKIVTQFLLDRGVFLDQKWFAVEGQRLHPDITFTTRPIQPSTEVSEPGTVFMRSSLSLLTSEMGRTLCTGPCGRWSEVPGSVHLAWRKEDGAGAFERRTDTMVGSTELGGGRSEPSAHEGAGGHGRCCGSLRVEPYPTRRYSWIRPFRTGRTSTRFGGSMAARHITGGARPSRTARGVRWSRPW